MNSIANASAINNVILKLDMEKAYDRLEWDSLFEVLRTSAHTSQASQLVLGIATGTGII